MTTQQRRAAMGHPAEREERQRRTAASRRQFGASPDQLRRLRRQTLEHMSGELGSGATSKPANLERMAETLGQLHAGMLRIMRDWTRAEIRDFAAMKYEDFIALFPDGENDLERNPAWYH